MTDRDLFGPRLRRLREQRGISLKQLADATKVDVELWAAMERNDFCRWPRGIFARAFVREYARLIDVDPEDAVNDFCRLFAQGDRRRGRIIQAGAELLGFQSEWRDDLAKRLAPDRRQPPLDQTTRLARRQVRPRPWRIWLTLAAFLTTAFLRFRRTASNPAATK